ncbi:glycosyltransferase family 4 protein [Catalinimonas niigatensis]|uniref:glycosyltransferase family 4 protein n=1 Tax=Catalinimonas niigatensis TaxID=1397264 RepID=UPI0026668D7C|nr:glycosyltransferase family 4 protein [Catalinimonas niigatensis]WPP52904.1 glycosyltransferase family 4 protein [Catalinimonas niigatensis]
MKIALCSKGNFSLEKGFTKNRIELAEGLRKLGWETLLIDKQVLGIPSEERYHASKYGLALKEYLIEHAYKYDVVLYEYDTLPFDRSLFSKSTLFVARPAILAYHFPLIKFRYNLKTKLSHWYRNFINTFKSNKGVNNSYERIDYCLSQSDLIQVQNQKDRDLLVTRGFSTDKIIIVPNGISTERIAKFNSSLRTYQEPFTVAFVGTFDFRKGAMDFPLLLRILKKRFPSIKLKLLGTRGMFYSSAQVLRFFPKKYHTDIEVVPKFDSEDLPNLLDSCHIGVFPSYLESFGFGALEMMCSGLPVIAYDVPGPSDFVLPELLAPIGDYATLSEKIILLLEHRELLEQKAVQVREAVISNYCWEDIARKVDANYRFYLNRLQEVLVIQENR